MGLLEQLRRRRMRHLSCSKHEGVAFDDLRHSCDCRRCWRYASRRPPARRPAAGRAAAPPCRRRCRPQTTPRRRRRDRHRASPTSQVGARRACASCRRGRCSCRPTSSSKAVMIGLAFASLVTWTIFIAKLVELFSGPAPAHRGARPASAQSRSLARGAVGALGRPGACSALSWPPRSRAAAVGGHVRSRAASRSASRRASPRSPRPSRATSGAA